MRQPAPSPRIQRDRRRGTLAVLLALPLLAAAACASSDGGDGAGPRRAADLGASADLERDAGSGGELDSGTVADAGGSLDTGSDTGGPSGVAPDAAPPADIGADTGTDPPKDAGGSSVPDASVDARPDDAGGEPLQCYGDADDGELPERVIFRSATTSFNRRWVVALHQGRIWYKPNAEAGQEPGEWAELGHGLPEGAGLVRFPPPQRIVEISADGTWLHALSAAGVFYRGTDFTGDLGLGFGWSDTWGHPASQGPGITAEFPTTHGWSVSDSQRGEVHHYEDRLGTVHGVGMGVAHLYRLGADGRSLMLNDWWLPADWSRQICLPDRDTRFADNISASASTVFIVGALGALYTRLYDFDTAGENDTLEYSFLIAEPTGNVRSLPAEGWRRQPDIEDGLITRRISIHQDGQGNAARELRVEGVRDGQTGFFHKHIFDERWSFEATGMRVCGPFLNAPGRVPPAPVQPADRQLEGTLERNPSLGEAVAVGVDVLGFHLMCSPTEATLNLGGQPVTVHGEPLRFALHHVHTLTFEQRDRQYWLQGEPAAIRAALLVPAEVAEIDDEAARATVRSLFEDRRVVNFQGSATLEELTLDEMTWLDPLVGVVPGNEKADPGNTIELRAVASR